MVIRGPSSVTVADPLPYWVDPVEAERQVVEFEGVAWLEIHTEPRPAVGRVLSVNADVVTRSEGLRRVNEFLDETGVFGTRYSCPSKRLTTGEGDAARAT